MSGPDDIQSCHMGVAAQQGQHGAVGIIEQRRPRAGRREVRHRAGFQAAHLNGRASALQCLIALQLLRTRDGAPLGDDQRIAAGIGRGRGDRAAAIDKGHAVEIDIGQRVLDLLLVALRGDDVIALDALQHALLLPCEQRRRISAASEGDAQASTHFPHIAAHVVIGVFHLRRQPRAW